MLWAPPGLCSERRQARKLPPSPARLTLSHLLAGSLGCFFCCPSLISELKPPRTTFSFFLGLFSCPGNTSSSRFIWPQGHEAEEALSGRCESVSIKPLDSDVTAACQLPHPGSSADPPELTSEVRIPEQGPASFHSSPMRATAAPRDTQCLFAHPHVHTSSSALGPCLHFQGVNSDSSGGCRPHGYLPHCLVPGCSRNFQPSSPTPPPTPKVQDTSCPRLCLCPRAGWQKVSPSHPLA